MRECVLVFGELSHRCWFLYTNVFPSDTWYLLYLLFLSFFLYNRQSFFFLTLKRYAWWYKQRSREGTDLSKSTRRHLEGKNQNYRSQRPTGKLDLLFTSKSPSRSLRTKMRLQPRGTSTSYIRWETTLFYDTLRNLRRWLVPTLHNMDTLPPHRDTVTTHE